MSDKFDAVAAIQQLDRDELLMLFRESPGIFVRQRDVAWARYRVATERLERLSDIEDAAFKARSAAHDERMKASDAKTINAVGRWVAASKAYDTAKRRLGRARALVLQLSNEWNALR